MGGTAIKLSHDVLEVDGLILRGLILESLFSLRYMNNGRRGVSAALFMISLTLSVEVIIGSACKVAGEHGFTDIVSMLALRIGGK